MVTGLRSPLFEGSLTALTGPRAPVSGCAGDRVAAAPHSSYALHTSEAAGTHVDALDPKIRLRIRAFSRLRGDANAVPKRWFPGHGSERRDRYVTARASIWRGLRRRGGRAPRAPIACSSRGARRARHPPRCHGTSSPASSRRSRPTAPPAALTRARHSATAAQNCSICDPVGPPPSRAFCQGRDRK